MIVARGYNIDFVLDLDLISFDELVITSIKNRYRERIELAWESFAAAQCASQKDFKKAIIEQYSKIAGYNSNDGAQNDQKQFLRKFKGGI